MNETVIMNAAVIIGVAFDKRIKDLLLFSMLVDCFCAYDWYSSLFAGRK